jgi:beta-galactosidase/beta-glucuronidase
VYVQRLRLVKSYGFNFVRHHSAIMPPEYYEACDELGMLVSAEFPIAYENFYRKAGPQALENYKREWAAAIEAAPQPSIHLRLVHGQ